MDKREEERAALAKNFVNAQEMAKTGERPYTIAQRILLACGVDPYLLEAHRKEHARKGRLPQHCKRGPGRYHQQGPLKEKV